MVATPAIKAMIRDNKLHNLDTTIQLGTKYGMQTMNQSLSSLVKNGMIIEADALQVSMDRDDFMKCMMQ
jgi:twitching motility protein PilT